MKYRTPVVFMVLAPFLVLTGCAEMRGGDAKVIDARKPVAVQAVSADPADLIPLRAALAYAQSLDKMSAADLARERSALSARGQEPLARLQLAMLYGRGRTGTDLQKAIGLLDAVAKSRSGEAAGLQGLARLLTDQYAERLRLDEAAEHQMSIAKDAQRRGDALQEKLDALAAIERSLPARSAPPVPAVPATGIKGGS